MPFFVTLKALSNKLIKNTSVIYTILLYLIFSSLLLRTLIKNVYVALPEASMTSFKWQFHSKVDLICKFLFQSGISSKAIQIGAI